MSVQFLKPAGPRLATSQTDTPLEKIDKIPWYIYFLGAAIYTAFAGWLLAESFPLGWFCLISAPVGFFYAWSAWKKGN